MFEDSAALVGILIAAIFITLTLITRDARLDGVGSVLIGERASAELSAGIAALARAEPGVCAVNEVLSLHSGPDQITAAIRLDFDDHLYTGRIERAVASIEARTIAAYPDVTHIFIRPQAKTEAGDNAERIP